MPWAARTTAGKKTSSSSTSLLPMKPYLSSGFMLLRGQICGKLNRRDPARSNLRECYGGSVFLKEEMGLSKIGHNRRLNRGAVASFLHSGFEDCPKG